jgi:hypothetical protein
MILTKEWYDRSVGSARDAPQSGSRREQKEQTTVTVTAQTSTATDAPNPDALTKQQIAALRTCDRFGFIYTRSKGEAYLDAVKDGTDAQPWEQRKRIPVANVRCESYQEGMRVARAWALLYNYPSSEDCTQTFLSCLRPGDVVTAHIVASNNTPLVTQAGLYLDYLYLQIRRGKKTLSFLVDVSVCPDNSARLAQMEPGSEWDRDN